MELQNYIYMVSKAWHEPKIAVKIMSDALKETQILKNQPGSLQTAGPNTILSKNTLPSSSVSTREWQKLSNILAK
jgi:hypothetical protein